jgi:hypothetical protein
MAGYMRVSESVLPVFAFLGCDVDGEKTLSLVIGAQDFHYVVELKALPFTEELRPGYFGWLSLLPVFEEEEPSSAAAQAAGELHLVGERIRNADGSDRIVTFSDKYRENSSAIWRSKDGVGIRRRRH